jgi:hypothetical protein
MAIKYGLLLCGYGSGDVDDPGTRYRVYPYAYSMKEAIPQNPNDGYS